MLSSLFFLVWKVHYSKTGLSYVYCVFVNTCNFYLVTVIFFCFSKLDYHGKKKNINAKLHI